MAQHELAKIFARKMSEAARSKISAAFHGRLAELAGQIMRWAQFVAQLSLRVLHDSGSLMVVRVTWVCDWS